MRSVATRASLPEVPPAHVVHFYEEDTFPDVSVAEFLWDGLEADESVVLFATRKHAALVRDRLAQRGVPVDALERNGRFLHCDARSTLRSFMRGHLPDGALFTPLVSGTLDRAAATSPVGRVRAYGECVALLADEQNLAASIALEGLWNELLADRSVPLYCAYPIHVFAHASHAAPFLEICNIHSHVAPVSSAPGSAAPEPHGRCIAVLQQQARALELEIAERRRSEARLSTLARLSQILVSSLDCLTTLDSVVADLLPALGDYGVLDVLLADGSVRRIARANDNPEAQALLGHARWCELEVAREGATWEPRWPEATLVKTIDDAWMRQTARDPDDLASLRRLSPCSVIVAPLEIERRRVGLLTLAFGCSSRRHDRGDLELAREVAQRTAIAVENARLYKVVQNAVQLRDDFLSTASHELRGPVTSLQLVIQSLLRGVREGRPSVPVQMLALADAQTRRLTELVDQLLDVASIEDRKLSLTPERFDVVVDTRRILDRIQMLIEQSRSTVTLHAREPLLVRWDRSRIDQLITNLLTNAASYGAGRPIDITLERHGDNRVRITIRDQGIGIRADRVPHIFERFERATSVRHYGGLGLGLFIAREVAEAHGGGITVQSVLGGGSTFTVDLPVELAEEK